MGGSPFKEDHILIIAPGSQTTLAQVGVPESFTPAKFRFPTRMFPAQKKGLWEPHKIWERKVPKHGKNAVSTDGDTSTANADGQTTDTGNGAEEDNTYLEEDLESEEGAVYPLREGRIVNWSCFFGFISHVVDKLSPHIQYPILLISQPTWTMREIDYLTQFFLEKVTPPCFNMMDSATAILYGYGVETATIVDIGYEKCEVTAFTEFILQHVGRGTALKACGGESMTQRLLELLSSKGFTRDMCEQLKRSGICEILPLGSAMPGETEVEDTNVNPAAAASAGANAAGLKGRGSVGDAAAALNGGSGGLAGGENTQEGDGEDNEGVLDVATIVASGKTNEFLARKEKEKAEKAAKAATKKAAQEAANAPKQAKLPNAKRTTATLHYTERKPPVKLGRNGKESAEDGDQNGQGEAKDSKTSAFNVGENQAPQSASAPNVQTNGQQDGEITVLIKKDIEVGVERFQAATGGILDQVADAIHRCILAVPDIGKRAELWDNLIIVGNGSRLKGFKEALLATLNSKYLISPSSATIFTSELPSNFTTPVATGANTPQPQSHLATSHHGPGVNPLLAVAVTASNPGGLAPPAQHQHLHAQLALPQFQPQQQNQRSQHQHPGHGQTPTSIKMLQLPGHFPEWKDAGPEEAAFIGAQLFAKIIYIQEYGQGEFITRPDYNTFGPVVLHHCKA
ncbi:MAG: hypothetical protein Q9166_007083 [cf. Caloplaca sp. 2 TL-2023]